MGIADSSFRGAAARVLGALNKDDDYRHNLITRLNKLGFNSYLLHLGMDNELQMIYFWK